jgi:glycine/D-amino acid oxidase-like deaminating enzyme
MPRLRDDRFRQQGRPLDFEMDGEVRHAIEGESIAAALIAAGQLEFRRDKSGAPRGPLCGMGVCLECEVSVDGAVRRACLTKARAGMIVRSLDFRVPLPAARDVAAPARGAPLQCDALVVGAGPAGLTTAIRLAAAGVKVIVADERPEPGGQFFKQLAPSYAFARQMPTDDQYRDGRELIAKLLAGPARLLSDASVWGATRQPDGTFSVSITRPGKSYEVQARQVVLATGAYESVPPFEGWTLPGVMTTGAAQGLVRSYRVTPGQRVLIAGNGPLNMQLAYELLEGGAQVVALAESARHPWPHHVAAAAGMFVSSPGLTARGMKYWQLLRKHRVPIYFEHRIAAAAGEGRVEQASIAPNMSSGERKEFAVDAVCVGYRLQPSNELARMLGCAQHTTAPGIVEITRGPAGTTSIPGVFVIGDGATLGGAHVAMAEGRLTADAILDGLCVARPVQDPADQRVLERHRKFQRHLWSLYAAPEFLPAAPDVLVCRCERVNLAELQRLIDSGVRDIATIKQLTRAGMGPCQGRYCQKTIAQLLTAADSAGMPVAPGVPRLPVKPVAISAVAAEKPEWYGYRTLEMPAHKTSASAAEESEASVLVIGAGIIGVCTALYLARAGVDVLLIDRGRSNGQASGANAGSLHLQLLSWDLPAETGADRSTAAQTLLLQKLGIDTWRQLESETCADFELKLTGGLVVAETEADLEFLRQKAAAERAFGVDVEPVNAADLRSMVPLIADRMIGGTYCAGEGKINPMLATPALLQAAISAGARFRPHVAVLGVERSGGTFWVTTNAGRIRCGKVVSATGGWSSEVSRMVGANLPVKSAPQQMIVTEATSGRIDYLLALARRHLTMKQAANGNLIIGGGWPGTYDAEAGRAVTLRESIEGNLWVAQRVIPDIGALRVIRSWATIGVMIDGAPIIGELPGVPGFFSAVGANGYTMGPIVGRVIAQLATTGEQIVDIRPFRPDRFH